MKKLKNQPPKKSQNVEENKQQTILFHTRAPCIKATPNFFIYKVKLIGGKNIENKST